MAQILDGKQLSQKIKQSVQKEVEVFCQETGVQPVLATVLAGAHEASQVYVKNKIRSTQECGMKSLHYALPQNVSQDKLLGLINKLNNDRSVHGILVQLPLPDHIDSTAVIEAVDPKKDVDGFHPQNLGCLITGGNALKPCTPLGIMELIKTYQINLASKDVLIIGRSKIVGKPLSLMMMSEHATVTVAHSKTADLHAKVRSAQILVAAVGQARFVKGDWLDRGVVVIDVGINRSADGKLCGDVDFDTAKERASFITPVPGGVGPMTIAMLLRNTLQAARGQVVN